MKTLKKVFAVGLVAAFASAGFAVQAGAEHTEPRFTLEIDPSQGLPGQIINAQVPDDRLDDCAGIQNPINLLLAGALEAIITENPQTFLAGAAEIVEGALEDPDVEGLLESVLFLLLFVDPATEDPVSDPGADHWNPTTGQGSIVAPGTGENPDGPFFNEPLPRPAVYFVAAVCLGLDLELDLELLLETLLDPLADFVEELIGEQVLGPVLACLANPSPECLEDFGEDVEEIRGLIEEIIGGVLVQLIDDDPDQAWVAPFCLLGGDGVIETCDIEEVVPAEPVPAEVTFAG